jgi:hypothetical protein
MIFRKVALVWVNRPPNSGWISYTEDPRPARAVAAILQASRQKTGFKGAGQSAQLVLQLRNLRIRQ